LIFNLYLTKPSYVEEEIPGLKPKAVENPADRLTTTWGKIKKL
jgi:hypothetical protein